MDELYTKHLKLLEYLYSNYTGLRTKPGKTPFMALEEFRNMFFDFELDKIMLSSEIPLCYNLAMMTQLDEVDSERCAEMNFVEFMEAFAHIADLSLPEDLGLPQDILSANPRGVPLCLKVEALLKLVAAHSRMPRRTIDGFRLPVESLFDKKGNIKDDD